MGTELHVQNTRGRINTYSRWTFPRELGYPGTCLGPLLSPWEQFYSFLQGRVPEAPQRPFLTLAKQEAPATVSTALGANPPL